MYKDPLGDLHNYSDSMTISQVVKFFERKGISFTKTMIQNYVRVGLLAPPDGRVYHAEHLKTLVIIDCLKLAYSLEEIRSLFRSMEVTACYDDFLKEYSDAAAVWRKRRDEAGQSLVTVLAASCAAAKQVCREIMPAE